MFVSSIKIERFRHLEGVEIGPLTPPQNSTFVALAGPNGGGKSSVLELLTTMLSTTWGWSYQIRRNFPTSAFEVGFGLTESDLAVMRDRIGTEPGTDAAGYFPRLEAEREYFRGRDLPGGHYELERAYYDGAHSLVARCLGDRIKALFFQSDRYYPQQSYNKNRYWESSQRRNLEYLRNLSFVFSERQYAEQMDFLVETAYDYPRLLGEHLIETRAGRTNEPEPTDPLLPYEALFQRLFPEYQLVKSTTELQDQLRVRLPGGAEVSFSDLSSGEKEVFFLLTFFIRYEISDSMVFIDEPELHLHPELARRLVQLMGSIQPRNQIWIATHNAELIAEAGRDRTYFMVRPTPGQPATSRLAADEDELVELLRTLFGFAGYVGLARRVVFLEGDAASADRHAFTSLFPGVAEELRFVPISSADNILRINRAALAILGETVGHTQFYLIRDRDYLTEAEIAAYVGTAAGRLFVLARHEIENYLLDFDALAEEVTTLTGTRIDPTTCARELKELGREAAGNVLRSTVAARLNRVFQPQDCSIGAFESNREWLDASMNWDAAITAAALARFDMAAATASANVAAQASPAGVQAVFAQAQGEIVAALAGADWRLLFPGKELLAKYAQSKGLGRGPQLQNALIRNLAANPGRIDPELINIVETAVGHAV